MKKKTSLQVQGILVNVIEKEQRDYISLTDMLKAKDGDFFISDWLRNRNTVEFLSIREEVNNPDFNCGESAIIKSQVGLNSYKISVHEWVSKTNAIGLISKRWRYGWTYAHKDIAFEFWMWISPKFKIYLIKEFQRLKEQENQALDRNVKRFLTKMNYQIHTDAIKEHLIPPQLNKDEINQIYASEADLLNKALFWITAKTRKAQNPDKVWNMRDFASIEQLIILANIESMNAKFIDLWLAQNQRLELLNQVAISQMKSLLNHKDISKFLWLDSQL